ncbi:MULTISPECIES: glycosyltransferase [unclassified Arthrobacter]|uniref:glycosyltransferase n=1 Tax=unclassified Arthrobacter TaxID=235627 RepID=UPI001E658194|nr:MULTISPECIES: glycosyltransferase [unclassified Arthrobacter]MCC9145281.1 glycosyltransferase family 2 protein [Arthrobacter sp. zg-Y919]MDK1276509.1 glycosyltransferase [Arthrobacter sp. zg.Y919]WIB01896.1 glycosyltransferase [Arthrobacter sp. zg-Y919]
MEFRHPQPGYLLPLKWTDDAGLEELAKYLEQLCAHLRVLVVDGSDEERYAAHAQAFPAAVRHCRPQHPECRNGKVSGVLTGVDMAETEILIIADDDVRYTLPQLERIHTLLGDADVVRPQNYFPSPMPWHARWDTGRTLLNRAFGADYPGTLAVRTAVLRRTGGYSGDALFENLELLRTVRAAGGREVRANDLFIARIPASTRHFLRQRVRQAYDDMAQPLRLAAELSLLPALVWGARRPRRLIALAAAAMGTAEYGRRRDGGRQVFGPTSALWAPLWLVERALGVWVAVHWRLRGGVPYSGTRLKIAAHSVRWIRRSLGD